MAAALALLAPLGAALAAGSPIPVLAPAPRHEAAPQPMRIVRVMSAAPECGQNCPEWISAEGIIVPGTAAAFSNVLADLRGRRLPVLISSPGGSVREAIEMGWLIRTNRLAVAVARTFVANCPGRTRDCPARGRATADGAICASACPLVLAAGADRLVGPSPRIGVHQITTVLRETPGGDRPVRTVKMIEQAPVDRAVEAYLASAGVGEPVMELLRKTPPASIRWLSLDELQTSRLATAALTPSAPIRTTGANGLDGAAFGAQPLVVTATAPDADGLGAVLTLTYRRGGGALDLALAPPGGAAPSPEAWSLAASGGALVTDMAGGGSAHALLSREKFCAAGERRVAATASGARPLAFALDGAPGVADLVAEACP